MGYLEVPIGRLLANEEKTIINNIVVPGLDRVMMPKIPTKSKELRASEKTELYPFAKNKMNKIELERAITIKNFEDSFKEKLP